MRVVSNTSPLLNLAIIDRLSLLRQQFPTIHIPSAVLDEFCLDTDLPGVPLLRAALDQGWMQVAEVHDQNVVRLLRRDLDHGEAAVIALALQEQADWTLLDEREGRRIARSFGLQVTGVIGILLRAYREREQSLLRHDILALQECAGFYISDALLSRIIPDDDQPDEDG